VLIDPCGSIKPHNHIISIL